MLSAGGLGVIAEPEFADMMKSAQWWGPAEGQTTLTRDAAGWPTSDAEVLVTDQRVNMSWNGPDPGAVAPDLGGTYHLSFHGQATLSPGWPGNYDIQNQVYNVATNTTTADLVVPTNAFPMIYVDFTHTVNPASATGAGVSDISLIRPGLPANTTQVYSNEMLAAMKPFSLIRSVDLVGWIDYPTTNADGSLAKLDWSQRRLPSEASQTDESNGHIGVAWEYIVALANETNQDLWVNVPETATNGYVQGLANLLKNGDTVEGVTYAGLKPGLKVYLEYSDEVWGGSPAMGQYNTKAAVQEAAAGNTPINNDGTTDPTVLADRRYLERSKQIADIFAQTYGADPSHNVVRPVLEWQQAEWDNGGFVYFEKNLPWYQSTFGPVSQTFYGLGTAAYSTPSDARSVDAVINTLAAQSSVIASEFTHLTTIAHNFGLKTVAYEGGPNLVAPAGSADADNELTALRDPRMEAATLQNLMSFYAAGGDLLCFTSGPYGIWSPYGNYPAAEQSERLDPSLSAKYRALVDVASAAPVAATSGQAIAATGTTTFSATIDTLNDNISIPHTGDSGYFLLNAAVAGNYDLSLLTNSTVGNVPGQVSVFVNGQPYGGHSSVLANSSNSLGTVYLSAGLNTLRIDVVHGFNDPSQPADTWYYAWEPVSFTLQPHVIQPPPSSVGTATFLKCDTATQGTWKPIYGGDGYSIAGDPSSNNPALPGYVTVVISGASVNTWVASASDRRALQKAAVGSTDRLAAAWVSPTSFSIDIHISDGKKHQMALYMVDWIRHTSIETVKAIDDTSGAVLDTRTVQSYGGGKYLVYTLGGNVTLEITGVRGDAVVDGLFFGGGPAGGGQSVLAETAAITTSPSIVAAPGGSGSAPSTTTIAAAASPNTAGSGSNSDALIVPVAVLPAQEVPGSRDRHRHLWGDSE